MENRKGAMNRTLRCSRSNEVNIRVPDVDEKESGLNAPESIKGCYKAQ